MSQMIYPNSPDQLSNLIETQDIFYEYRENILQFYVSGFKVHMQKLTFYIFSLISVREIQICL